MAQLTADLPLANSSRRIIDPGGDGPSWLQGLASGAAKAVNVIGNAMDESEANSRRSRAEEAAARQEAARNAAAGLAIDHAFSRGVFGEQPVTPAPNMEPIQTPIDSELEGAPPPADVVNSVDEARRARAAEEQGRAPSGSSRIVLERSLNRLLADFPDQAANILKEFRENGFDHYLMRERDTEEAIYDNNVTQQLAQRSTYAEAARRAGASLPGMTVDEEAAIGQRIAQSEYTLKLLREDAEEQRKAAAEGRQVNTHQRAELERQVTADFGATMSAALMPSFNAIKNLASTANGDQSFLEMMPDALNSLDLTAFNIITAAQQNDAPPETIAAMREQWKGMRSNLVDLISGPGSELGVAAAVLDNMQTTLGINMAQALPVFVALKDMFGMAGLESFLGENPANSLPPELRDSIRREISGVQGAIDTNGERVTMATVAQMLRGQLRIEQMDERQARVVLPTMVTAVRGQAPAIRQGGGNAQAYVNANLNVSNAALEIQPGRDNVQTEAVVIGNIMSNEVRAADLALMARDPQSGQIMIEAKRATAQHLLLNMNNASWQGNTQDTNNGLWTVRYQNGRYQTVITDASYRTWAMNRYQNRTGALVTFNGGRIETAEEMRRQGPPRGLTDRIGGINLAVDYLVETNQFDDRFAGVGATEARDFFVTGSVPRAMRARSEQQETRRAPLAEQIESVRTMVNEQRVASEQLAVEEITERPIREESVQIQERAQAGAQFFQGVGWSPEVAAGIVGNLMAESELNTGAVGDGGQAHSIAQWHPDRRANARREGFDLSDYNQALRFVQWELENSESAAAARLRTARTAEEAADAFALHFLRPAGAQTGDADRVHNIAGRRQNATRLYRNLSR